MANPVTIGSGVGSSLGTAREATWGTWVTPTRWTEEDSFTLKWVPKRIVGKGLRNGAQLARNAQRQQVSATVNGDVKTNFYYKGMGQWLGSLMGSLGVAPVVQGATAAYLQTHALAASYNQSICVQAGIPDLTGLINQYNFNGVKVIKAVIECALDGYLMCNFTLDGRDYDQVGAYGAPAYQTLNGIFAFNQAALRMGAVGSEVIVEGVRKWILTLTRPMKVDNFYTDGTGRKQQQVQNAFFDVAVDLESDYISDAAFVAQFTADTAQSMIMDFLGPQIAVGAGGTKAITAVSAAAGGAVITATAHGYVNGQTVIIAGVVGTGAPSPNGTWIIDTVTANTFRIGQNNTGFTYTSGGTAQLSYNNQVSFQVPCLRWDGEAPTVAGPDIVQPKMKLVGLDNDVNTPPTQILYMSTDVLL